MKRLIRYYSPFHLVRFSYIGDICHVRLKWLDFTKYLSERFSLQQYGEWIYVSKPSNFSEEVVSNSDNDVIIGYMNGGNFSFIDMFYILRVKVMLCMELQSVCLKFVRFYIFTSTCMFSFLPQHPPDLWSITLSHHKRFLSEIP